MAMDYTDIKEIRIIQDLLKDILAEIKKLNEEQKQ